MHKQGGVILRILFLLDNLYAPEGITMRLARQIGRQLLSFGHQVSFLVNSDQKGQEAMTGLDAVFFCDTREKRLYDGVKSAREQGRGIFGQAIGQLAHPGRTLTAARLVLGKASPVERTYRKQLEALCAARPFDVALSVSAPHYTMFALAGAAIPAKKVCYMLDPYWSNQTMRYMTSPRREAWMYSRTDAVLLTDVMMEENLTSPLAIYRNKMHVVPFPGIRPPQHTVNTGVDRSHGTVNFLFLGNLYPGIRPPHALFRLMEYLPENVQLTMAGGGREGFPPGYFDDWQQKLGPRVALLPPVRPGQAAGMLMQADVLVNIGNQVSNQLPSKVFEYISTGKPILNLCQVENCPSRRYLDSYPLALSLAPGISPKEGAAKIMVFLQQTAGQRLPYHEVEKIFADSTPLAVARRVEDLLAEVCGEMDASTDGKGQQ